MKINAKYVIHYVYLVLLIAQIAKLVGIVQSNIYKMGLLVCAILAISTFNQKTSAPNALLSVKRVNNLGHINVLHA